MAPGPERGRAAGFIPPQRCAGRAPAAAVISSLFSHHRPFLPRILNSEISVKVRARFADSLCRKHGGAGESKAFAAGRPFFGRRCSPLRDQLSFPKPRERFVPHLKPTAEIPQGWRFKGCGRRRPPDSPEKSGCSSTGSCWCRGRSWGSPTAQQSRALVGALEVGGRCRRVLGPLQPLAAVTESAVPEQEQGTPRCPRGAPGQVVPVAGEALRQAAGAGGDAQRDAGSSVAWGVMGWGGGMQADLLLCAPECLSPKCCLPVMSPQLPQGISCLTP